MPNNLPDEVYLNDSPYTPKHEAYAGMWQVDPLFVRSVKYIPAKLNRQRAIATVAKIVADDPTLPDELAGALMQITGVNVAKPYEVEE